MEIALLLLAVLPVATFVVWPLFTESTPEATVAESQWAALERRKVDAYRAIKEAEFDQRMGKLSDEDFTSLVGRYREQALAAIAALESRTARRPSAGKKGAAGVNFCPSCGEKAVPGGRFCAACGAAFPAV
jgi:ribosomal protein L32